jgi:catechol 2,3-dioxygenase-like lactoylglutathione lyase family enzyme
MLGKASVIGFIPVRDLKAAETFYSGALGLEVVGNDGFALVLNGGSGSMIRCVLTPDAEAQPFTILGWEVPEMRTKVAELKSAGINPKIYPHFSQDGDGIWTAPDGSQVLWFNDPFGNVLSLSRHGANVR